MMQTKMATDMRNLVSVGVVAVIDLRMTPVSIVTAAALLDLISTTVDAVIEETRGRENWDDDFVLVPVVELQSGSLKAVIGFLAKKRDEFVVATASGIVSGVATAWLMASPTPPADLNCPIETIGQVAPKMEKLVQELDATKKPYDLYFRADATSTTIILKGNQPPR